MLSFHALFFSLFVVYFFLLKSSYVRQKLIKFKPSNTLIGFTGCYVIITTAVLSYICQDFIYWYILPFTLGIWLIGAAFVSKKEVSSLGMTQVWEITQLWLISALFCLPINLLWHWWHLTDYLFLLRLSLAHLSVILFLFPLSLGIITLVIVLWAIVYVLYTSKLIVFTDEIMALSGCSILIFIMIIYSKMQIAHYRVHNRYLKNKAKRKQERDYSLKLKHIIHNLYINATEDYSERDSAFLQKVVKEVMASSLFLEDDSLYKEDFSTIEDKFVMWSIFLKQHSKSTIHLPLLPTEIPLNELIQQLEVALSGSDGSAPKLSIAPKNVDLTAKIVCDVRQVIDLLVSVILRIVRLDQDKSVRMQLHTTRLKYYKYAPIKQESPPEAIDFPAIALTVSSADMPLATLPKINSHYEDITEGRERINPFQQVVPEVISVQKKPIERIIRAHYGYLQLPVSNQKPIILVLPYNVTVIRDEMLTHLVASNICVNKSEIEISMVVLMQFKDYVCKMCAIRISVIDEILLLLRRCYGFRRHVSGEFFYVRAVGIARFVTDWVSYVPEPIYAALLYDLVVYTGLPLAYIKANYSIEVFCFVQSIISIDDRRAMEPSGLYVDNKRNKVVNRDQLFVLCIKLAERLYDLQHASGYIHKGQVSDMAKETLTVDIFLAKRYLDSDIVEALETAAQEVLEMCLEKE